MAIYYGLYAVIVSVFIFIDAPLHNVSRWWALGTLIIPFLTPYYFTKTRPAKKYWKYIGIWLLGFLVFHVIGTAIIKVHAPSIQDKFPNQLSDWKTFVSNDKKFTTQFPTEPDLKPVIFVNTPAGNVELLQYISKVNDIQYEVAYGDFPSNAFIGMTSVQQLDNARNGAVENVQGKLLNELIISKGNYPGREITVKVEPNIVLTEQIILNNNRLYQIIVIAPGDKLFIAKRSEFFNSFKILK